MPIYEYQCRACQHAFEHLARSSRSRAAVACPECGSQDTERQLSVFAARQGTGGGASMPEACERCGENGGSCPYRT
jgi:putative FmdB family regulatory protein